MKILYVMLISTFLLSYPTITIAHDDAKEYGTKDNLWKPNPRFRSKIVDLNKCHHIEKQVNKMLNSDNMKSLSKLLRCANLQQATAIVAKMKTTKYKITNDKDLAKPQFKSQFDEALSVVLQHNTSKDIFGIIKLFVDNGADMNYRKISANPNDKKERG